MSGVLGPPGSGEFVHVGGDTIHDRPHPREVDGDDGPVWPVGGRAQADRWRIGSAVNPSSTALIHEYTHTA